MLFLYNYMYYFVLFDVPQLINTLECLNQINKTSKFIFFRIVPLNCYDWSVLQNVCRRTRTFQTFSQGMFSPMRYVAYVMQRGTFRQSDSQYAANFRGEIPKSVHCACTSTRIDKLAGKPLPRSFSSLRLVHDVIIHILHSCS